MKTKICFIVATIHLFALAAATLIASFAIESILATGIICSLTGLATFVSALLCRRFPLAVMGVVTPLIAISLFVAEAVFLRLGPNRAAFPFCMIFIFNQSLTTILTLTELEIMSFPPGRSRHQITIRSMLITTTLFAAAFAALDSLPVQQFPYVNSQSLAVTHPWAASICLALFLLTVAGLVRLLAISSKQASNRATGPQEVPNN